MLAHLQARHHGLSGDGAKLIGESTVEDQDVHSEDPLADGCSMLEEETLMDEEDAAWRRSELRETQAAADAKAFLKKVFSEGY